MSNHRMNRRARALGFIAALALAAACASCRAPGPRTPEPPKPLGAAEVRGLVEKSLPAWDQAVLAAKDGPAWSEKLGYDRVLDAMADEPAAARGIPAGARRVADKDRVMRLEPESGRVRYIHRGRAWTAKDAGAALGDKQAAAATVRRAVASLGVPGGEVGAAAVDTQIALGGAGGGAPTERHELYRLVSVSRQVNGLPVSGSRALGAVTHQGAIQRMLVRWPAFVMRRDLALRSREAVASQIVEAIMRQNPVPSDGPFVAAELAYAPESHTLPHRPRGTIDEDDRPKASSDDDEAARSTTDAEKPRYPARRRHAGEAVRYVPVVIVSVSAGETPYQMAIPVAEPRPPAAQPPR